MTTAAPFGGSQPRSPSAALLTPASRFANFTPGFSRHVFYREEGEWLAPWLVIFRAHFKVNSDNRQDIRPRSVHGQCHSRLTPCVMDHEVWTEDVSVNGEGEQALLSERAVAGIGPGRVLGCS